jgi:hypothetical protein
MLRRIFGPRKVEVTGEWRKLHNEELRDLYNCIIRIIKLRRMRYMGHVAPKGEKKNAQHKDKWKALVNVVMNLRVP